MKLKLFVQLLKTLRHQLAFVIMIIDDAVEELERPPEQEIQAQQKCLHPAAMREDTSGMGDKRSFFCKACGAIIPEAMDWIAPQTQQ